MGIFFALLNMFLLTMFIFQAGRDESELARSPDGPGSMWQVWAQQLYARHPGEAHEGLQGEPFEGSCLASLPLLCQTSKILQQRCVSSGIWPLTAPLILLFIPFLQGHLVNEHSHEISRGKNRGRSLASQHLFRD